MNSTEHISDGIAACFDDCFVWRCCRCCCFRHFLLLTTAVRLLAIVLCERFLSLFFYFALFRVKINLLGTFFVCKFHMKVPSMHLDMIHLAKESFQFAVILSLFVFFSILTVDHDVFLFFLRFTKFIYRWIDCTFSFLVRVFCYGLALIILYPMNLFLLFNCTVNQEKKEMEKRRHWMNVSYWTKRVVFSWNMKWARTK